MSSSSSSSNNNKKNTKNDNSTTKIISKSTPTDPKETTTTSNKNKIQNNNNNNNNNDHVEYEFFGPIGAFGIIIILPVVVLLLLHWSDIGYVDFTFMKHNNDNNTITNASTVMNIIWNLLMNNHVLCPNCITNPIILIQCFCCMISWFLFLVLLERYLPCDIVEGNYIQNDIIKGKLKYHINGHLTLWITIFILYTGYPIYHIDIGLWQLHTFPIEMIYKYLEELAFCTIILSFILNTFLYVDSFRNKNHRILAKGGNTGNIIYDYFIGRELNPRIGTTTFDWKVFCELRPGMIGWILINLSCCKAQYQHLGYNTYSMYIIVFFQALYVWDALYNEKAILTTMDITTDGFGFMLVFGDLVWVPFTYSLQARYLVLHDPHLSMNQVGMILFIFFIGFYIFRSANSEKDAFRTNPDDPKLQHLKYISTKRGTKLLISGWWGMARKINYTGDYILGLCWCLLCGFDSVVPYYYAIYFGILLFHRSLRDDLMCQEKYGSDWETYKKLVPYKFIPGIV